MGFARVMRNQIIPGKMQKSTKKTQKRTERAGDAIGIDNLDLMTVLGVFPEERESPRRVVADLSLELDLARAGRSDDLSDTVDWAALCRHIREWAALQSFRLSEAFAEALAARVLAFDRRVRAVTVGVRKPGAFPEMPGVVPSVRIRRKKTSGRHAAPGGI